MEGGLVPLDRFYWSCCPLCIPQVGSIDSQYCSKLFLCSRCRCVSYCGKEHQRRHWKAHRPLCSYLSLAASDLGLVNFFDIRGHSGSWFNFRISARRTARIALDKRLTNFESELFLFPKVCRICNCYSRDLLECPDCLCVAYCSSEHKETHRANHLLDCSELKAARMSDEIESKVGLAKPYIPFTLDSEFRGTENQDMMSYLSKIVDTEGRNLESELQVRFLSDRLSGPLTLLMAIERFASHLLSSKQLVLHIVGANSVELVGLLSKWEFLLRRLPKCNELTFLFIGPELGFHSQEDVTKVLCGSCGDQRRILRLLFRRQEYARFCLSKDYVVPHLVAAFNCGFHVCAEQDYWGTWKHSLPFLLRGGATRETSGCPPPLLFSSYSLFEARQDLDCIKKSAKDNCKMRLEILVDCQVNPFRSHRPKRDTNPEDGKDVFYNNQYYSVVHAMD